MHTWGVIGYLVGNGILPPPMAAEITIEGAHLKFRHRSHVDAWTAHLGMPPALVIQNTGAYGSIQFWPEGGWCGHKAVYLYTKEAVG